MPNSTETSAARWDEAFAQGFESLLAWRRDVRRFRRDPVERDLLLDLLRQATLAPSVGHSQPWRFVLVDDPARRDRIAAIFETENARAAADYDGERGALYRSLKLAGLREAPVHLAVYCDEATGRGLGLGRKTMPEMLSYSVVCAIHTLWLAARLRGIALGWVSVLDPPAVSQALDLPSDWRLVAYLCLGRPEEEASEPELARAGWEPKAALADVLVQR